MPRKVNTPLPASKVLIVDKLSLIGRAQSPYLYARYKHPRTGKWLDKSTRTSDSAIAEEFAWGFFKDLEFKVKHNIPTGTHNMNKLIDLYLEELKYEFKRNALSESNYKIKLRVAEKFIRPYFKDKPLHTIDKNLLREFANWRKNYWLNQPADAVIEYTRKNGQKLSRPIGARERNSKADLVEEKAILNSLFELAIQKQWIKDHEAPRIDFRNPVLRKGRTKSKVKPNAYFTIEEYKRIKEEMFEWAHRPAKFRYRRLASYYYVMLAFNCGVRPGTGIDSLRWKDLIISNTHSELTKEERELSDKKSYIFQGEKITPTEASIKAEIAKNKGMSLEEYTEYQDTLRLDIYAPTSKVGSHHSIGLADAIKSHNDYKLVWLGMAQEFLEKQKRRGFDERPDIAEDWDEDDPIFLLPNGYHLTGSKVWGYFRTFLEEKNMLYSRSLTGKINKDDSRSLYSTRHSFITMLVEKGIPLGIICEFTGTSLEMLQKHYTHHKVNRVGRAFTDYLTDTVY